MIVSGDYDEQAELMGIFMQLLWKATGDGSVKRQAGRKPSWKVDPNHEAGFWSHVNKWKHRELVDPDSGAHPMVHAAWRALAIAVQETAAAEAEEPVLDYEKRLALSLLNIDPDLYGGDKGCPELD